MTPTSRQAATLCFIGLAAAHSGPAGAQASQSAERVAAHTDWSVFVADEPKECYLVSPPTDSVARRDGEAVEVDRGDIRLFVTFRPGENVANEVSFTSGYPLRDGSTVRFEVGSSGFDLSPGSGEGNGWAWPASTAEDARLVEAMRAGAEAVVTGVSARGTTTVDTFSLMGFSAAMGDAETRCR